jgi:hypothetical protein
VLVDHSALRSGSTSSAKRRRLRSASAIDIEP